MTDLLMMLARFILVRKHPGIFYHNKGSAWLIFLITL